MKEVEQTIEQTSSVRMLQTMTFIGIICALLIVLSYQGTLPRVEQLKAAALEKAIFKVVPGMVSKKAFRLEADGRFTEVSGKEKDVRLIYAGYDQQGKLLGVALEAAGMGFADLIKVIYGYDPAKEAVVGFYVLETKETPGLGDKIEKDPAFLANFEALDVSLSEDKSKIKNKIVAVKHGQKKNTWEVDGITGATISSRAVGNILGSSTAEMVPLVHKSKHLFEENKRQ